MAFAPRVLVTRASHQGSALADQLRQFGLEAVLVPAIEIMAPSRTEALDAAMAQFEDFDWLVISSSNAVPALSGRLRGGRLPGRTKLAAIGPSTARALEEIGLTAHLVPPQAVAESLADALLPYARCPDGRPARFLYLRAEQGRDYLPDRLKEAGARVTVVPAYRTVIPWGGPEQLRAALAASENPLRAATFTSSSTARNLLALCEAAQVRLPADILRISIGPITSATMRSLGWPPSMEAPAATVVSLAETVANALKQTGHLDHQ